MAAPPPNNNPDSTKPSSMYLQDTDEVRKVFARFDANGDGKISADELAGVLKALGSDTSREEVSRVMQEIDKDSDGHISLEDFAAFCGGDADPYGSPEKELRGAFEMYDRDKDGKISAKELHVTLTRLGERCSVGDCEGMIGSVDEDGDGYVGFGEFRKMMTSGKK